MPYADRTRQVEYKKLWNKKRYAENTELEKERIQKRKNKIAEWFNTYKATLSCQICGEKTPICLDFHHRKKGSKDFKLGLVKSWGWGIARIQKEIAKCIVICANCHRKFHAGIIKFNDCGVI